MVGLLIFLLIFALIVVVLAVILRKETRKIKQNGGSNKSVAVEKTVTLTHLKGLDFGQSECKLFLFVDKLRIDRTETNQSFELPIENIRESKTEPVMKQKGFSVGKAVLGEAIAGPIGAVVGGSSGRTKQDGTKQLLVIRFASKDGEEKELVFLSTIGLLAANFNTQLNANIIKVQRVEPGTATQQL